MAQKYLVPIYICKHMKQVHGMLGHIAYLSYLGMPKIELIR